MYIFLSMFPDNKGEKMNSYQLRGFADEILDLFDDVLSAEIDGDWLRRQDEQAGQTQIHTRKS